MRKKQKTYLNPHTEFSLSQDIFGIKLEGNIGKKVELMCNLSEYVEERGIQQGLKEGVKKGVEQEKFATAERMLKAGFSDYAQIASFTTLEESVIREIAKKMA